MDENCGLIKLLDKALSPSKGERKIIIKGHFLKLLFARILDIFLTSLRLNLKIKAKTFWGEDMLVIIPEIVSLNVYGNGLFEEGLTRMILEYLKPGMTFFDIGAHFGYFTLLSSRIVGKEGRVHSFEPCIRSFELLSFNTAIKDNVVLNNCAVFSKQKTVALNDYGIKYSAYNSMYDARLPQNVISKLHPQKYSVQAIAIDEYVQNRCLKPDFVKIDSESSEYEVLLGMNETINKFHPILSVEVGDTNVNVEGIPASKRLISFVMDKGYQPYEFKNGKIFPHVLKDAPYHYDNLLFLQNRRI